MWPARLLALSQLLLLHAMCLNGEKDWTMIGPEYDPRDLTLPEDLADFLSDREYDRLSHSRLQTGVEPEHENRDVTSKRGFLSAIGNPEIDNATAEEWKLKNYFAGRSKKSSNNDRVCRSVCHACEKLISIRWSSLCRDQCQKGGRAFDACFIMITVLTGEDDR